MPTAGGLYFFLHEGGSVSKPPVILIHGAGGNHLFWPPEIRRLPGYRTFALDLPGHGKSEGPGTQSIPDYTRSVLPFLDDAGLSRAVLVGHSMGGAIALTMAIEQPDRVAGIILVATGAQLSVASVLLENAANPSTFPLALKTLQRASFSLQTEAGIKELAFKRLSSVRQTLLYGDFLACDAFDVRKRLKAIQTPTLVICGTEDKLTPLPYSEALASAIPGAALQTVDGAGHMVMLEQPRRVAGLLRIFLATIPYIPGS